MSHFIERVKTGIDVKITSIWLIWPLGHATNSARLRGATSTKIKHESTG
jgi:hypothetical protein